MRRRDDTVCIAFGTAAHNNRAMRGRSIFVLAKQLQWTRPLSASRILFCLGRVNNSIAKSTKCIGFQLTSVAARNQCFQID